MPAQVRRAVRAVPRAAAGPVEQGCGGTAVTSGVGPGRNPLREREAAAVEAAAGEPDLLGWEGRRRTELPDHSTLACSPGRDQRRSRPPVPSPDL